MITPPLSHLPIPPLYKAVCILLLPASLFHFGVSSCLVSLTLHPKPSFLPFSWEPSQVLCFGSHSLPARYPYLPVRNWELNVREHILPVFCWAWVSLLNMTLSSSFHFYADFIFLYCWIKSTVSYVFSIFGRETVMSGGHCWSTTVSFVPLHDGLGRLLTSLLWKTVQWKDTMQEWEPESKFPEPNLSLNPQNPCNSSHP